MEDIIKSVVGSVIVAVLSGLFFWLRKKYSLVLSRRDPRIPSYLLGSIIIIWFFAGIFIHYLVFTNDSLLWLLPVYLVWSFSLVYYFWNRRQEFRTVGIKGADKEVRHGIDYKRSLKLCNNRLKFLGIGASKLTEQKEFEEAIRRCAPDQPIKFLLCKPTHDCLVEAAKRFGVDRDKYKNRVISSLRVITDLKTNYKNIEVRFYPRIQLFRIMLIDDSLCLFSYNVMGQGDGSQLPQLHISKSSQLQREGNTFYYPFERYFDELWDDPATEEWNFSKYLENE